MQLTSKVYDNFKEQIQGFVKEARKIKDLKIMLLSATLDSRTIHEIKNIWNPGQYFQTYKQSVQMTVDQFAKQLNTVSLKDGVDEINKLINVIYKE